MGEQRKDQVPLTSEDYKRITDCYNNYGRIEAGTPELGTGLPSVRFIKKFSDGGQIEKRVALRKMSIDIGTMNKILLTLHASDLIEEELVARRKSIITLKAA